MRKKICTTPLHEEFSRRNLKYFVRKRKHLKHMHGGVMTRLLYSQIPCIQRDMAGSCRRGAGVVTENQITHVIATQLFAAAIACEGRLWERGPGLGTLVLK